METPRKDRKHAVRMSGFTYNGYFVCEDCGLHGRKKAFEGPCEGRDSFLEDVILKADGSGE